MKSVLVLGGARSGKSNYAAELALGRAPSPVYVATSRAWDADHSARIARHQRDRGCEWTAVECEKSLSLLKVEGRIVVVDCMTLWLTNYFVDHESNSEAAWADAKAEIHRIFAQKRSWIFVSNELGLGVHAATEAGRRFVDIHGFMNQLLARHVDEVVLLVAGIPLVVKSPENHAAASHRGAETR